MLSDAIGSWPFDFVEGASSELKLEKICKQIDRFDAQAENLPAAATLHESRERRLVDASCFAYRVTAAASIQDCGSQL
ncbi:hypothetical protein [Lacipirellula limnantheis]|uniref:hypothetical protein n=1 Tax=Lacipirellula limnantheis TaxID=2528024 RepID=UPI0011A92EFB|nr:hypothetical protein [Lacipirellula limnantheis]